MTVATALPTVVCDTDAGSFIVKDDPIRGARYLRHLQGHLVILPFPVLAELRLRAELRNWAQPAEPAWSSSYEAASCTTQMTACVPSGLNWWRRCGVRGGRSPRMMPG
jgi:hypothetical protein